MEFEKTIQYAFERYPILYQKRWQVLNQLFCVIGNGYEWKNGELVEKMMFNDPTQYNPILIDGKAHITEKRSREVLTDYISSIRTDSDEIKIQIKIDGILSASENINFYPLSKYSKIFTYPDNIKPDWLDGIRETVALLLEHNPGERYEKMNHWQKEEHREAYTENHTYTEKLHQLAKDLNVHQ